MMQDLSPAARALLDAAREELAPDAAALRRVRDKIDAAVAGGSAAGGSAIVAKLAIVSVIALVVAGALLLRGDNDVAATPALALGAATSSEVHEQRVHDETPAPAVHIEMPAHRASRPRAAIAARELDAARGVDASATRGVDHGARAVDARTARSVDAPASGIDLAREVELVDAAMAALRNGDPTAAIASVRLHRAETAGRGQLAEDAAAIEIEALCKLHDRRVIPKLEAFDARWPDSAQRSRLTTNCF